MSYDILVDGIPPSVTEEELSHLFSACGTVLAVSLEKTLAGVSLGIARIQMSAPDEAEQAVRSFHHAQISGCTLLVFPISNGQAHGAAAAGAQNRLDVQQARLQCPYCSTLMLDIRGLQLGPVEWLCPACRTTRERTIPSPPGRTAIQPEEDSRSSV